MNDDPADLDIVVVSHRDGHWLDACLRSLRERAGGCRFRVVLVENGGGEEEIPASVREAPEVHLMSAENRGFAAGNNVGLTACSSDRILFLNPDTELVDGTLAALAAELDDPRTGAVAVKQLMADGTVYPSLRRYPSVRRALAQALAVERIPGIGGRLGERILDPAEYERRRPCDWTTGAVLLARAEAVARVGGFDDRFFMYSEETDLCRRITGAGWTMVHVPDVAFIHHAGKAGFNARRDAQLVYARLQYAEKHFGPVRRIAHRLVLGFDLGVRALVASIRRPSSPRALSARAGWQVVLGRAAVPPLAPRTGNHDLV